MSGRLERLRSLMSTKKIAAALFSNPVNIAYLSGFTGTAGCLLVTAEGGYLFTDFRYLQQAQNETREFTIVDGGQSSWHKVADLLALLGIDGLTVEADHLTVDGYHRMDAALSGVTVSAVPSLAAELRRIKSVEEQSALEAVVLLTDRAFLHIQPYLRAGVRERDVALELEFFLRRHGATAVSFQFIVASGHRSALPHGVAGDKLLAYGDAVVLDFGCILNGYCSDLTRTVFVGSFSKRQRQVYNAVLAAQKQALAQIRAGIACSEADALARDVLAEHGLAEYFGHGLGHGLGREVHEAPRVSAAVSELLSAGMVITVEPGVYLGGEFGVRLEDVVVVEEKGVRNLTQSVKDLLVVGA
ncbi:MAG: aminopeptidase P family protein [Dethiobacter sp.]|nr:aminopeptidase P family protein [Dethiobacter sp.]MBS3898160.1 aminopeptidase P family protein [Dethiobacter sp.]